MLNPAERARITAMIDLLESLYGPDRLVHLKHFCVHNDGIWAVPENPADYAPVLYEVQLG